MHKIGILLADGFQAMALAPQSVFEVANVVTGEPFYAVNVYSMQGGTVRSSLGMDVMTKPITANTQVDTWLIGGKLNPLANAMPDDVMKFVRTRATKARRVAGVCTGAFVLAEAGLLDGKRATTHWFYAADLRARFPNVKVEDDRIYIVDGSIWTSAGMTAVLDLALALVEKDLGSEVARNIAHKLVMHQYRSGGQTQHSELLNLAPKTDRIQNALNYVRKNLSKPLNVETLASVANLSPRQFSRVFTDETGQSPAKAIESLRLEAARLMIEQSHLSLDEIARETGFTDRRHMREAFLRGFGVAPQSIRRNVRAAA
jgi:transcriptional regulator GlxA family with amidase domain